MQHWRAIPLLALCASPAFAQRVMYRFKTETYLDTSTLLATAEVSEATTIQITADAVFTATGNFVSATLTETALSTIVSTEPAPYTQTIQEISTAVSTIVSDVTTYIEETSTAIESTGVEETVKATADVVYATAYAETVTAPQVFVTVGQ